MAKVESFELDHHKVLAPYVRQAGQEVHQSGAVVSKFDLRFLQPNQSAMPTAAMHTLEHLLAVNLRDYLSDIIDISPMGCRTGFYLIAWGQPSVKDVRDSLRIVLDLVVKTDFVPAITAKECGNYRDHSLYGAKEYAKEVLEKGISLDPFVRILEDEGETK